MTDHFFCADGSSQMGEDLIGSATSYQTYILVECPFPWKPVAFDSQPIPQNLRNLVESVKQAGLPILFLLINRGQPSRDTPCDRAHVLIYQRSSGIFCQGYQRWEATVTQLEDVAPLIQLHLAGQLPLSQVDHGARDLLVCVHGSHDKCCAKYGLPFYREAIATIAQLNHEQGTQPIRLWQTSHFGGHRFAPTLIDFPTGRYYGRLNQTVLQSIMTRSGDLQTLSTAYRGWSILPNWMQCAEQELMKQYGWQWFDYKIAYRLMEQSVNQHWMQVKIAVLRSDGLVYFYRAEIVKDSCRTVCLKSSCGAAQASEQVKYRVKSLVDSDSPRSGTRSLPQGISTEQFQPQKALSPCSSTKLGQGEQEPDPPVSVVPFS
jgi:hypothetical protein